MLRIVISSKLSLCLNMSSTKIVCFLFPFYNSEVFNKKIKIFIVLFHHIILLPTSKLATPNKRCSNYIRMHHHHFQRPPHHPEKNFFCSFEFFYLLLLQSVWRFFSFSFPELVSLRSGKTKKKNFFFSQKKKFFCCCCLFFIVVSLIIPCCTACNLSCSYSVLWHAVVVGACSYASHTY